MPKPFDNPEKLSYAERKRIVQAFDDAGVSRHSAAGKTLRVVIDHCVNNGYAFRVLGFPKLGYVIERVTEREILEPTLIGVVE